MHCRVTYAASLLVLAWLVAFSYGQAGTCTSATGLYGTTSAGTLKANATNRIYIGVAGYYAWLPDPNITTSVAGAPASSVIRYYAGRLNNDPSILPDTSIELNFAPNSGPYAQNSLSLSASLIGTLALSSNNTNMTGLIAGQSTAEARVTQQAAQINSVPQISIHAIGATLSNKGDYPTFMRTIPSEVDQNIAIIATMVRFNWTRAVIAYSTNDYGAGYTGLVLAGASYNVTFASFPVDATQNSIAGFTPQMTTIANFMKAENYRILVLYTTAVNTAWMTYAGNNLGIIGPKFVWILSTNAAGVYTQGVGPNSNFQIPIDPKPYLGGSIGITVPSPSGPFFNAELAQYKIQAAVSLSGLTPYSPTNLYYFSFIDVLLCFAHAYQNLMDSGIPFSKINNATVLSALKNVSFDGVAGPVKFNQNGDRLGIFTIQNYVYTDANHTSYITFAQYSFITSSVQLTTNPTFNDGTQKIPSDGSDSDDPCKLCAVGYDCVKDPVTNQVSCIQGYTDAAYSRGLAGGLAAVVGVGFLVTLFSTVMLLVYNEIFFQKHGIFYCVVVIVGVFFAYAGALTLLPERTDSLCLAFPWLIGVAFTFVYGCLFIKAWILYRIWRHAMQLKKMAITAFTVVKYVGVALAIEVIFLIIWSTVDPPTSRPHKMNNHTIQYQCHSNTDIFWIIFVSMKGVWLMFGVVICVLTRNIMKEYSNFNQTVYAIYNMLVLIVIAIPLTLLMTDTPDGITIICVIVLVLAFMFTNIILFFETWFSILSPDANKIPAVSQATKRAANDTTSTRAAPSSSERGSSSSA